MSDGHGVVQRIRPAGQYVQVEVATIDRAREVGAFALATYLVLRRHHRAIPRSRRERELHADGVFFSSLRLVDLTAKLAVSVPTALKALDALEGAGWIKVDRSRRSGNLYVFGDAEGIFVDRLTEIGEILGSQAPEATPGSRDSAAPELNDVYIRTQRRLHQNSTSLSSFKDRDQIRDQIKNNQIPRTLDLEPPREAPNVEHPNPSPPALPPPSSNAPAKGLRRDQSPPTPPPGWRGALEAEKPTRRSRKPEAREADEVSPDRPPIDASELEALRRARAKREAADPESHGEYAGEEAIALWRAAYWRAFGVDDAATEGRALRAAAADLYVRRLAARQWADGSSSTLFAYLRDSIDLWAGKRREGDWPPGPAPTLEQLLREDRGKGPSRYWLDWRARRAKAGCR